jgi:hypothetical protein
MDSRWGMITTTRVRAGRRWSSAQRQRGVGRKQAGQRGVRRLRIDCLSSNDFAAQAAARTAPASAASRSAKARVASGTALLAKPGRRASKVRSEKRARVASPSAEKR